MRLIVEFVTCVMLLGVWHTNAAVYKIDVTTLDISPLIGYNTEEEYRAYLAWNHRDATFDRIGRLEDTGTGEVGTGHGNPGDDHAPVPSGSGFPHGTFTNIVEHDDNSNRLEVTFRSSSQPSRIGVFYSTVSRQGNTLTIPTIKLSGSADIKPLEYTHTVSIGDVANLRVTTFKTNLRWVHNNGDVITQWNDIRSVTIDNVRVGDGGIYECYEDGRREDGKHAIIRLVVRECPGPKYGSTCAENCQICWSGGICAADDGTCLCQQGFSNTTCENRCEDKGMSNHWGASCSLYCSDDGSGDCGGRLICGPDPLGCSCVAGYMGLDCTEACPVGKYGANCDLDCHCANDYCDPALGCELSGGAKCDEGYDEHYCEGATVCATGYYGTRCEYQCHCHQGAACNKDSGICSNGCAEGWAGTDCQQALPALYNDPRIMHKECIMIEVDWDDWDQTVDYGNGPVESYRVYYRDNDTDPFTDFVECEGSNWIPQYLQPDIEYDFRVSAWRSVDGSDVEGKLGNIINGTTHCLAPTKHPTLTEVIALSSESVLLKWTIPEGDDWIHCSSLESFIITYFQEGSNTKTTQRIPSTHLTTTIKSLLPCASYEFQIQASNKHADGVISPSVSTTTDSVAPGKVMSLSLTPFSPLSINIEWMPPLESQCDVTGYNVSYTLTLLDQCIEERELMWFIVYENTGLIIRNLQPYSTYEITVHAISGSASGPEEYEHAVTEEIVPRGSPENLTVSSVTHQLSYDWLPPQCDQRNGVIVAYEYQFGESILDGYYESGKVTSLNILFRDLSPSTWYGFRIRAYTTQGAGPFTEIVTAKTKDTPEAGASKALIYGLVGGGLAVGISIIVGGVIGYRFHARKKVGPMIVTEHAEE